MNLKRAHRLLAPRVAYLIGTRAGDGTSNLIPVSNVTSISTDPQQLAVAIYKEWTTRNTLLRTDGFTVSVPRIEQLEGVWKLGAKYSRFSYSSYEEKLSASGLDIDATAVSYGPVLRDGTGWLAVRVIERLDYGGDHTVFIGEVDQVSFNPEFLTGNGEAVRQLHPVMQVTGNTFTTSGPELTVPYLA